MLLCCVLALLHLQDMIGWYWPVYQGLFLCSSIFNATSLFFPEQLASLKQMHLWTYVNVYIYCLWPCIFYPVMHFISDGICLMCTLWINLKQKECYCTVFLLRNIIQKTKTLHKHKETKRCAAKIKSKLQPQSIFFPPNRSQTSCKSASNVLVKQRRLLA